MESKAISTSEWEVMRVVWNLNGCTTKQLCECLAGVKNWHPSTIKTLTTRLVKKELLEVQKVNNKHFYRATISETNSIEILKDELLARVCATNVGGFLISILEDTDISLDDLNKLEKLIANKKINTSNTIECNCLPGQCENEYRRGE